MGMPWTQIVFLTATFTTLPVYFIILFAICQQRRLSPFYVLMLSQGVADIFALINYFFLSTLRTSLWFADFFWEHQALLANCSFLTVYLNTFVRCIGITLISLQRYITICQSTKPFGKIISGIPLPAYAIIHWTAALLPMAPLCTSFNASLKEQYKPEVIVPQEMLGLATLMALIAVIVFFIISMTCYIFVLTYILRFNYFKSSSNNQEVRLCIQAAGLLIAFLLLFVYYVGQFIINHIGNVQLLFTWRMFNPLVTGFVSWVQPWMCLAFNTEIRRSVLKILRCQLGHPFVSTNSVMSVANPTTRAALSAFNDKTSVTKQWCSHK